MRPESREKKSPQVQKTFLFFNTNATFKDFLPVIVSFSLQSLASEGLLFSNKSGNDQLDYRTLFDFPGECGILSWGGLMSFTIHSHFFVVLSLISFLEV